LCKKTNQNISDIVDSLGDNSLILLFTGKANDRYFKEFFKTMNRMNEEHLDMLKNKVMEARKGISFLTIK